MTDPQGAMPTVYENESEMLNGNNGGGEVSRQLVSILPSKIGCYRSEFTAIMVDIIPTTLVQPTQLFDGYRIFIHAPKYHWRVTEGSGVVATEQEARGRIVALANLLGRFGHRIEAREEKTMSSH